MSGTGVLIAFAVIAVLAVLTIFMVLSLHCIMTRGKIVKKILLKRKLKKEGAELFM